MTRFKGKVGFVIKDQYVDDVRKTIVVEREFTGEILNETLSYVQDDKVYDDKRFSERISIVAAELYDIEKYTDIRYVVKSGTRWSVVSTQAASRPRLILSLGGVYNGEIPAP